MMMMVDQRKSATIVAGVCTRPHIMHAAHAGNLPPTPYVLARWYGERRGGAAVLQSQDKGGKAVETAYTLHAVSLLYVL